MPSLTVSLSLADGDPSNVAVYRFRMELEYGDGHRLDKVAVPVDGGWVESAEPTWLPDFGDVFAGGSLRVFAELIDGSTSQASTPPGGYFVRGANPPRAIVRGYVDDLAVAAVLHRESRFTQFKTTTGISNLFVSGLHNPLRGLDPGGTVGYGIGQLTTPEPRIGELWNWQENVDEVVRRLRDLRAAAIIYQGQVQQGAPWDSNTGGNPPNEGAAFPDAPDFSEEELDLEMYARYNGGYRYHNYDSDAQMWVRRLLVGSDAGTSLPYADAVLKVKRDASAGNPPAGWD